MQPAYDRSPCVLPTVGRELSEGSQGVTTAVGGSVVDPDLAKRFAEIVVNHFFARSGKPAAPGGGCSFEHRLPPLFDGGHHFRNRGTGARWFGEKASIQEQRRLSRVLAADTRGYLLHLAAIAEVALGLAFQVCPEFGF